MHWGYPLSTGLSIICGCPLSEVVHYPGFSTIQGSPISLSAVAPYPGLSTIWSCLVSGVVHYPGFSTIRGSPLSLSGVAPYPGLSTISDFSLSTIWCCPLSGVVHKLYILTQLSFSYIIIQQTIFSWELTKKRSTTCTSECISKLLAYARRTHAPKSACLIKWRREECCY